MIHQQSGYLQFKSRSRHFHFWLPAACGGAALEANISGFFLLHCFPFSFCSYAFYPKHALLPIIPLLSIYIAQHQHQHCLALALALLSISIAQHQHCLALALLRISVAQHWHQHSLALALLSISIAQHWYCLALAWLNPMLIASAFKPLAALGAKAFYPCSSLRGSL